MFFAGGLLLGVGKFSTVLFLFLLLFVFFIYYIVGQSKQAYIMSLILLSQAERQIDPLLQTFQNIHRLMVLQFQATKSKGQNIPIYCMQLQIHREKIQLQWRFQNVTSNNNIKVYIRPILSDEASGNFKVQTQRGFVDLLMIINNINRDKNKSLNCIVSEYNFIQLCTIFAANLVTDIMMLRKLIKSTIIQLPETILRLITMLKPFLQSRNKPIREEGVERTAKLFLQKSLKMLLVTKFNQIKREDQLNNQKDHTHHLLSDVQIEGKLQLQRTQAHKKMKDCLKLLGFQDSYLKSQAGSFRSIYIQWMIKNKQAPKKKEKLIKNVHGIKIINQNQIAVQRDREGTHCRIILTKFKLLLTISVNNEVNKALQDMKKKDGKPLISQTILKIEKELELVKKLLKDPQKKQSKNSFQNELEFILYIKQRGFQYISTYYWQYEKKRAQMQTIIMDYYPHNLREMIKTQGKLLSFREKIVLMHQITSSVNWLVSNYVCHRDIKPQNIMINEHRMPKLIDFGSCCPVNGVGNNYFRVKQSRLLGTPNYYRAFNENMCLIYKRNEYEQHFLFDAYSLGKVMRDIFQDGLPNLLPNMQGLMKYMIERCEQENPADRLTYQQMLFLFDSFIQYLDWLQERIN